MKATLHPVAIFEPAASIDDTLRTEGWKLIRDRMAKQRGMYVGSLLVAKTWDEARFLQGQIAAVDRSLELPAILKKEIGEERERTRTP